MSDETEIVVCQGPPRCMNDGDAAVAAQQAGCRWCRRILIDEFGNETLSGPPLADERQVA